MNKLLARAKAALLARKWAQGPNEATSIKVAADFLSRVVALAEARGWQDISSAPKDWTKIDLWFPHTGRAPDWHWEETPFTGPGGMWLKRNYEAEGDEIAVQTYPNQTPTHWMKVEAPE